jgi:tripeptide aminopeptidase
MPTTPNPDFDRELEDRLVRYCRIDTQSDESTGTHPSTPRQLDLLNLLVQELNEIGASDVRLTDYGTVLATIPSTVDRDVPTIAFLGHVDTATGYVAEGVKPLVHRAYDGSDIVLPDDPSKVISPTVFPYLGTKVGEDIVTASGTTLLGADDKAGCAVAMALGKHLLAHPDIPHGRIRLAFTADEEIGGGVQPELPKDLEADIAYTLDGGDAGEVVYETFSGDRAVVTVTGVSTHPGDAKDQMVNALHLLAKIIDTLPQVTRTPETTSDRQGFIHAYSIAGGNAEATASFILRDFEREGLAEHGALISQVCSTIAATEPRARITCEITPSYRNMRYWLENDMRPVDLAKQATIDIGLEPISPPVRGGTDGSRLTEMGVPTPNLFTGMQNLHGPLEYISVQDMTRSLQMCIRLAELWAERA